MDRSKGTFGVSLATSPKMLPSTAVAEHAASFLLSMLLRQRQVSVPMKDVLLSTSQPLLAIRALEQAHDKVSRSSGTAMHGSRERTASPSGTSRAADLLVDVPAFRCSPEASAAATTQFVILTAAGPWTPPASDNTVCLPLSLLDVAQYHRARHCERFPSLTAPSSRVAPRVLLEGPRHETTAKRSLELYCGPASKDFMILDIPPHQALDDYLWEGLFVAESMLEADGTLLVVSPHAFSRRVRRFLQWRFNRAHCSVSEACAAHYALCTAVAADFGDAAVRRDDFPGQLPAGKRRPRKWNPYRRLERQKFVASLRPGFTNAPFIKDALRCSVERDRDAQERLRDADDAFFAVTYEMVEKGGHYSQPND
ncbi:hypothetical protein LSCM4_04083 [Leishmania orientalis]|uniref:Uncharacterized protein n=1 Tax=Leishmania orientalis TaxID=2249476 RepID=A0A836GI56_9TRYP|nr:hypothetical protein LSCM4_04083 [Leishmania orientalis]